MLKSTGFSQSNAAGRQGATLPSAKVPGEGDAVEIHRGRWIEGPLQEGQLVGVGGSIFSSDLTMKARLDLSSFEQEISGWPEKVLAAVDGNRARLVASLEENKIEGLEADLLFIALNVQRKTDALLNVEPDTNINSERMRTYDQSPEVPLSELKGRSACAERALLAKHLLHRLGVNATYMSGVATHYDAEGRVEDLTNHSFLILQRGEQSLIFDVARPHSTRWPRLVIMDHPLTLEIFMGTDNLLVAGRSPFSRSSRKELFGVGEVFLSEEPKVLA
jgi:hypothetical protein